MTLPNLDTLSSLSVKDLRAVLLACPGWQAYRVSKGVRSVSDMSKADLIHAVLALSGGTTEPGTTEPGTTEPDTTEPGTTEPDTTEPGTDADPLASLRGVLSPALLAEPDRMIAALTADLTAARADLADARTRPVAVPAAVAEVFPFAPHGRAARAPAPVARPAAVKEFKAVFGGRTHDFPVPTFTGAASPAVDPDYLWPDITPIAVHALEAGQHVFLFGPKGTGKSSFARQYAARTGRPHFVLPMDGDKAYSDLFGMTGPAPDGGMGWTPGDLLTAMQTPHAVISLDEIGFGRPELVGGPLQTLLEDRAITLRDGTVVAMAEGVRIIATNNNSGADPHPGSYAGLRMLNAAFRDRFSVFAEVDYLSPAREISALVRRSRCPRPLAEALVTFAGLTRKAARAGDMTDPIGFRRLAACAKQMVAFPALASVVWDMTVRQSFGADDQARLDQLAAAHLSLPALAAAAGGTYTDPDDTDATDATDATAATRHGFTAL